VIIYGVNIYKNKESLDYYKTDSYKEVTWKWGFKVTTLILLAFAIIILKDVFSLQWVTVCIDVVLLILAAIIELETLVCLMMVYFKRKIGYLRILLGIVFIALLNNTHFINLLFGSVGILFVAQYILSDNFFDYLKNHYSKYDMITIKRYMKANKTRFLAFSYLITFSVNVIFMIKLLLPSGIKEWLKNMILNVYNWLTRTNIPSEIADPVLINTVILGIIILFYTLIDSFLKGKFKKPKASILKYIRENLQEKKVGKAHG
jgi:membrane protein